MLTPAWPCHQFTHFCLVQSTHFPADDLTVVNASWAVEGQRTRKVQVEFAGGQPDDNGAISDLAVNDGETTLSVFEYTGHHYHFFWRVDDSFECHDLELLSVRD